MELIVSGLRGCTGLTLLQYERTSVAPKSSEIHLQDRIHSDNFDKLL